MNIINQQTKTSSTKTSSTKTSSTNGILNCPNCFKVFKKKSFFEKHLSICERSKKYDQKEEIIPSNKELYILVNRLFEENNKLRSELNYVKSKINIKYKKIDIETWLNKNINNYECFFTFLNNFIDDMQVNIIDSLLEKGFINTIIEEIYAILFIENKYIKCFKEFKNTIYIRTNEKWIILEDDILLDYIKKINVQIFYLLDLYTDTNKDKFKNNDSFQNYYNKNLKKIISNNLTFEQKTTKIKNKLYENFKEDLTEIVIFK